MRDFLRAKQLLVLLDNCEHLVDAAADPVKVLVEACPEVVVLATSREALGVDGERMLIVPPLDVPADGVSTEVVGSADAVTLFVERAARQRRASS